MNFIFIYHISCFIHLKLKLRKSTGIEKRIFIKAATWRRPLVTARLGANGADNGFQLQMSQLEAEMPFLMQTNGQGRLPRPATGDIYLEEYAELC